MLTYAVKIFPKAVQSHKYFNYAWTKRHCNTECDTPCNPCNPCTPCIPCPPCTPCPPDDNGDRQQPERQEPGIVRLGFIPNEWFEFFFNKTGVTGLGTFCFTVGTLLFSKEFYILEHEYYNGLSMILLCALGTKYVGPLLAKYLDTEIDDYENSLNEGRAQEKKAIEECIAHEEKLQLSAEGQLILVAAKRENVALQREAAYRERCMQAYVETKKRLEFCVMREAIEKAMAKRCMTDWVVEHVRAAVSKEIEDQTLTKCMEDLKELNKTFEKLQTPYPEETLYDSDSKTDDSDSRSDSASKSDGSDSKSNDSTSKSDGSDPKSDDKK